VPAPRGTRRELAVGVVEISAVQSPDARVAAEQVRRIRRAGFDSIVLQAVWSPGARTLSGRQLVSLRNGVDASLRAGLRVFLVVAIDRARDAPVTAAARTDYAAFAAAAARRFPRVRDVVVGNEPNLNTFWLPQFGPDGTDAAAHDYEAVLAAAYDALKHVSPAIRVIGGALAPRGSDNPLLERPTHSPTQFVLDLGAAYRASGRTRPLMDGFAMHPYLRLSRIPPTASHAASKTITLADYPKLTATLARAFGGTAQRGATLPIYYTEFGVQTTTPRLKLALYLDLGSPAARDAVSAQTQGRYYVEALRLAACQPTVRGFFIFHSVDEPDLRGWQSGLYYADGTPKPSLPVVRRAIRELRASGFACGRRAP
jgi:hypothetical protein